MKYRYVCPECRSPHDLRFDAWAEWDAEKQEYVLHCVFTDSEQQWCEACEMTVNAEQEETEDAEG